MSIIDLHCDTVYCFAGNSSSGLMKNELAVDIDKLIKGGSMAQFFALFVDLKKTPHAFNRAMDLLNKFYSEINLNSHKIAPAKSYADIIRNKENNKISAFLTIEEGEAVEGSIRNLKNFYDLGVRLMTLTWNYENSIGYPNFNEEFRNRGLKPFGIEVVNEMNNLGMLIDVSHLSDGGFYDVAKYSKAPFVASHSNSREMCCHPRNLTDDMIRVLSDKGGVMGLNFAKEFLEPEGRVSSVSDMVRHISHIKNVGGIDVIALGTDFDGIEPSNLEISNAGEIGKLIRGLESAGFTGREIDKITHENALRVIKEVL